ncbi:hypothetical protein G5I_13478 [Acromyrmex echinatior]|uniref:Uncharacterized protein n=1 Tax=Acromyrmex echinatior TaxID=103372 RepID=F4X554_ACREC|nr:hypothetical protein G5I_13478 [Acromyrmex echinatior]
MEINFGPNNNYNIFELSASVRCIMKLLDIHMFQDSEYKIGNVIHGVRTYEHNSTNIKSILTVSANKKNKYHEGINKKYKNNDTITSKKGSNVDMFKNSLENLKLTKIDEINATLHSDRFNCRRMKNLRIAIAEGDQTKILWFQGRKKTVILVHLDKKSLRFMLLSRATTSQTQQAQATGNNVQSELWYSVPIQYTASTSSTGYQLLNFIPRMESGTIERIFTCDLCEEIVGSLEIVKSHSCLMGYAKAIFDENLYFYPQSIYSSEESKENGKISVTVLCGLFSGEAAKTVSNMPVCNNNMNIEDEEEKENLHKMISLNSKKQRINRNSNQDSIILAQISEALRAAAGNFFAINSSNERRRFRNDDFLATSSISKISGDN